MAVLINKNSQVLIQGITGREGSKIARESLEYGTQVAAGVRPGKGGTEVFGIPVYDTVEEALKEHEIDVSLISVPPQAAQKAAIEASSAGIKLTVIVTERIPRRDVVELLEKAERSNTRVIGPNSMGMIVPGAVKIGMIGGPAAETQKAYTPGTVGIMSRSGGMTTELANLLTQNGLGQSTCISIGGDPIIGSTFRDLMPLFEDDEETKAVVIFCEPGGVQEEVLADYVEENNLTKPIVAFVAGRFADKMPGVRFGHAAAIVEEGRGSPEGKIKCLRRAGIEVAESMDEITVLIKKYI